MPSLDWNTAGTCFSNVSEALPLLEIGLYLLITVRCNPDSGADCSILRQAIITSRVFAGGRARSIPARGPRRDAAWRCTQGCSGWARQHCRWRAELQGRAADPASTALPLPGPQPATPPHKVDLGRRRVLVWHLCRRRAVQRAASIGRWKGDAVRAVLCLQDSRGQCCFQGGAGFSSLNLLVAAPVLRAAAWCMI